MKYGAIALLLPLLLALCASAGAQTFSFTAVWSDNSDNEDGFELARADGADMLVDLETLAEVGENVETAPVELGTGLHWVSVRAFREVQGVRLESGWANPVLMDLREPSAPGEFDLSAATQVSFDIRGSIRIGRGLVAASGEEARR